MPSDIRFGEPIRFEREGKHYVFVPGQIGPDKPEVVGEVVSDRLPAWCPPGYGYVQCSFRAKDSPHAP